MVFKTLISVITEYVSYIISLFLTYDDLEQLSGRLFSTPEQLATELHMRSVLFGESGDAAADELIQRVLIEWIDDDPRASSLKLIQHLINLNESDTVEWWVCKSLSKEGRLSSREKQRIDAYHLRLLSQRRPSDFALFVTAQAIAHNNESDLPLMLAEHLGLREEYIGSIANQLHSVMERTLSILVHFCRHHHQHLSTCTLIRALGGLQHPTIIRAADVLKLQALCELQLCVIPDRDERPDDAALSFISNHMTLLPMPLNRTQRHCSSYLSLMKHLKDHHEYYALVMVLMMTGSARRERNMLLRHKSVLNDFRPSQNIIDVVTNNTLCATDDLRTAETMGEVFIRLQNAGIGRDIYGIIRSALGEYIQYCQCVIIIIKVPSYR